MSETPKKPVYGLPAGSVPLAGGAATQDTTEKSVEVATQHIVTTINNAFAQVWAEGALKRNHAAQVHMGYISTILLFMMGFALMTAYNLGFEDHPVLVRLALLGLVITGAVMRAVSLGPMNSLVSMPVVGYLLNQDPTMQAISERHARRRRLAFRMTLAEMLLVMYPGQLAPDGQVGDILAVGITLVTAVILLPLVIAHLRLDKTRLSDTVTAIDLIRGKIAQGASPAG